MRRFLTLSLAFLLSFALVFSPLFYPKEISAQQEEKTYSLESIQKEAFEIDKKFRELEAKVKGKYEKEMWEKIAELYKEYEEDWDEYCKRREEVEREYVQKIEEEIKRLKEERKKGLAVVCEKLQKFCRQKVENLLPLLPEMPYFPEWEWEKEEDYGGCPLVKLKPEEISVYLCEWEKWVTGDYRACTVKWYGEYVELVKEVEAEVYFEEDFQRFIDFLSKKTGVKFNPFTLKAIIGRGGEFKADVSFYIPPGPYRKVQKVWGWWELEPYPPDERPDPEKAMKIRKEEEIRRFEDMYGVKVKVERPSPDLILVERKDDFEIPLLLWQKVFADPGWEYIKTHSASLAEVVALGFVEDPEWLGMVHLNAWISIAGVTFKEVMGGGFEEPLSIRSWRVSEEGRLEELTLVVGGREIIIGPEELEDFQDFLSRFDFEDLSGLVRALSSRDLDRIGKLGIEHVPWSDEVEEYIIPPDDLLNELLNSVNLYFSRIKVGKVPVERKKKEEKKPEKKEKVALPEEDYLKLIDISPVKGEELVPEKEYTFKVKVEYGLSSKEKGVISLEILTDEKPLVEPIGVEVEKGMGEESIEAKAKVPRKMEGRYIDEVTVCIALLPEGERETEIFEEVSFPVNQEIEFFVEAEREKAVANGKDKVKIEIRAQDPSGNPLEGRYFSVSLLPRPKDFNFLKGDWNLAPAKRPDHKRPEISLITDKNGKAEFLYFAPSVTKTFVSGLREDPFKKEPFDEIKIKDEITEKESRLRFYLTSPYPRIKKFAIAQPVYSNSWSPITIEIEDPDSSEFLYRLRISVPGRLDYEGKISPEGKGFIAIRTDKKRIKIGYEPPLIGFDISQVPTIGDKMWEKAKEAAWDLAELALLEGAGKGLEWAKKSGKLVTPVIKSDLLKTIARSKGFKKFLEFLEKNPKEAKEIIENLPVSPKVRKELLEDISDAKELIIESWQKGKGIGEALSEADWGKLLGYNADIATYVLGIANFAGKIGDWSTFGATTLINFLKGFEELYREYQDIANAFETTMPAFMMIKVEDSEGNVATAIRDFYIVFYEKGG